MHPKRRADHYRPYKYRNDREPPRACQHAASSFSHCRQRTQAEENIVSTRIAIYRANYALCTKKVEYKQPLDLGRDTLRILMKEAGIGNLASHVTREELLASSFAALSPEYEDVLEERSPVSYCGDYDEPDDWKTLDVEIDSA
ncbi:hypothetical protein HDU79_000381, partial [Rhizoclosmatium sp. JEL0117]